MTAEEWPAFQQMFDELFQAHGSDPAWALFKLNQPGEATAVLLIPERVAEIVRDITVGEWKPFPHPEELPWILLIGHADSAERLGLKK